MGIATVCLRGNALTHPPHQMTELSPVHLWVIRPSRCPGHAFSEYTPTPLLVVRTGTWTCSAVQGFGSPGSFFHTLNIFRAGQGDREVILVVVLCKKGEQSGISITATKLWVCRNGLLLQKI